jgi:uncharacterized protein (TIGR00255 family)
MTAFAARTGETDTHSWAWEARSVNGRGLDLRLRLPDGIDGLETAVRSAVTRRLARGNVTLSLRLERRAGAQGAGIDPVGLGRALAGLAQIETAASAAGVTLRPASAAEVLALRGVTESQPRDTEPEGLRARLAAEAEALVGDLDAMRAAEGAALAQVLTRDLDRIAELTDSAARAAAARAPDQAATLRAALARVAGQTDVTPDRIAQELALLAVKSDVTEEIDRLHAHVAAARTLLGAEEPAGRKLDFLTQEFNREANTLAAKAGAAGLTAIALDLKAVIDRFREQVQNVE